jgi:hypothetical protein
MDAKSKAFRAEYRNITLKTIDGSTLRGKVNIGAKNRVSDIFTKLENPFIVLTDVSGRDVTGKILFVNKSHIVWVEPED